MWLRKQYILLLSTGLVLFFSALSATAPERKVSALLTLDDLKQAVQEAEQAFDDTPNSKQLWKVYFQALSRIGEEKKLFAAWNQYRNLFPEDSRSRWILEQVAWGVIENGSRSPAPLIRLYASIGAVMGQDSRGVKVLKQSLKDPNAQIRAVTAHLSAQFRDPLLQDAIRALLKSERNPQVRLEAIRAMGKMKIADSEAGLVAILDEKYSAAEEKAAAIESLARLMDSPKRRQLEVLCNSNRAELRLLACKVIAQTGECADAPLLVPLLRDPRAEVRANAIQAVGILRIKECSGTPITTILQPLLQDPDSTTAIAAAWALTLEGSGPGLAAFEKWFAHPKKEVRYLAAGALASTGRYGAEMIRKAFDQAKDPYIKINLAVSLISSRTDLDKACGALASFLNDHPEKIMWENEGCFRYLTSGKMRYSPLIPNQPEAVDQIARLELLNTLAIMDYPETENVLRKYLQAKAWGVSGTVSALLLTEGDGKSLESVENLLGDPNPKVKIQAALILALWGSEEAALPVLQGAYSQVDKDMKERILEGLGRIASDQSIDFLIECLNEPSQSLRIIAASALLQCLYG